MAKEWILSSVMNRFQLNFKRHVGAVSEEIRKCSPSTLAEWESYYFDNVRPREHIEALGKRLYVKITEVVQSELDAISESDFIEYIYNMVISRTFDGYQTEIRTIYELLESELGNEVKPAPDEWDRKYNVDFYIKIDEYYIGLQIKPVSGMQLAEIYKEKNIQEKSHTKFTENYGGAVFYIYSIKKDKKKIIDNIDVIDEIKGEITKLENLK